MLGQQCLVGGDDILAGPEHLELKVLGDGCATDQFHRDADALVVQKGVDVTAQDPLGQLHRARRRRVQIHHRRQLQTDAHLGGDGIGFFTDYFGHTGSDRAETSQPDSYAFLFHPITCIIRLRRTSHARVQRRAPPAQL